ncbi:TetR/AcrR family transcriptional regulator [Streptosporangium amethystogenes]|uniref:TetR/AcrR family transcriptional regulator n=1 Tax=Streptosporangium amethystogenes TaxID=2002 RepID=UPI0037AC1B1D
MPTRRRGEIREEAILLAAMSLLAEVGYDQLTIEDIAKRASASKATIYRRWSGKADLVATAVRRYAGTPVTTPAGATNLRDDLMAVLLELRASLTGQDSALILGLLIAMRRDSDLAHTVRRHVLDHKREVFATVLARAVARGEVPGTIDHTLLAEISSAALLSRLLITGEPLDDLFLRQLVDAVLLPMLNHQLDQR